MSFVNWIKVSDLLPGDQGITVNDEILFSDSRFIYLGTYRDGKFYTPGNYGTGYVHENVTLWFKPELPK